jgi:hypothetical protein
MESGMACHFFVLHNGGQLRLQLMAHADFGFKGHIHHRQLAGCVVYLALNGLTLFQRELHPGRPGTTLLHLLSKLVIDR